MIKKRYSLTHDGDIMDYFRRLIVELLISLFFLVNDFLTIIFIEANTDLVIRGTTVAPNFIRPEEQLAIYCPITHPWSLGNGSKCCSTFKSSSLNRDIDFHDPIAECAPNQMISCPEKGRKCRSTVYEVECPQSHPQAIENGCCASQGAIFEPFLYPECSELLSEHSPQHCCNESDFLAINECFVYHQPCFTNRNMSSLEPIILSETTRSPKYGAVNALKDTVCGDIGNSFWSGPNWAGGWFTFDLQYHKHIRKVLVRNSHNGKFHDRATKAYSVLVSNHSDPFDWVEIASGILERPPKQSICMTPLVEAILPGDGIIARFGKFHAKSFYGFGPVLNFVGLE